MYRKDEFPDKSLTEAIIGVFYDVYNELGYGFLESVYEKAMSVALHQGGFRFQAQREITVVFRGETVGLLRADLVVEEKILLELKAADTLRSEHEAQLLNYLYATPYEVGLLLNFGKEAQIRRRVVSADRKRPKHNTSKNL